MYIEDICRKLQSIFYNVDLHNFEIWIIWIISVYVEICSRDISQNTHLTLEIQAPAEPNIINKNIMNRGENVTSSFPYSSFWRNWRNSVCLRLHPKAYSEPSQTPSMKHFAKIGTCYLELNSRNFSFFKKVSCAFSITLHI